jgi:hypothetical protein
LAVISFRAFTLTATCAVDQQHWNPPPPMPVESLLSSRRTYSPGALNVALVVTLPPCSVSIVGLDVVELHVAGSAEFRPGHRRRGGVKNAAPPLRRPAHARARRRPASAAASAPRPPQVSAPAAAGSPPRPRPRPRPPAGVSGTLIFAPSSVTHAVSGSGAPTAPVIFVAMATGRAAENRTRFLELDLGGVFLLAASSYGSTM